MPMSGLRAMADRFEIANALVGSWDVTLTLPGLPPGRVLATFDGAGGTVESDNATKLTGQTLVTTAALTRDLDAVRDRGYALEKEEAVLGEGGVAAPIFDRRSEAVGAIGVAGPRERVLGRGRERKLGVAVIEAARGISRDLGATRWPAI
jgi:DNA-binding IclR family transcriptional regulator